MPMSFFMRSLLFFLNIPDFTANACFVRLFIVTFHLSRWVVVPNECAQPTQVVLCVLVVVKEGGPNKGDVRFYPGTNMEVASHSRAGVAFLSSLSLPKTLDVRVSAFMFSPTVWFLIPRVIAFNRLFVLSVSHLCSLRHYLLTTTSRTLPFQFRSPCPRAVCAPKGTPLAQPWRRT